MTKDITFPHALSKIGRNNLKDMLKEFSGEEKINPHILKDELVETLAELVPEDEKINIIDSVFNTPKSRYTVHLGQIKDSITMTLDEIDSRLARYTAQSNFEGHDFEKLERENIELMYEKDGEYTFMYTILTRGPHYDPVSMTSNIVTFQKKVRVVVKNDSKRVIVFSGDREHFNAVLTALTSSLGMLFYPLQPNKTGITDYTRKQFSFDTVKFIDFIYNGLSSIGKISEVYQVQLENNNSKKLQRVKVQGDMLLKDKNVCVYLYINSRNLIGIKVDLKITKLEQEFKISCEFEIRDNRIKFGIKKDKYTFDELKEFSTLIEDVFYNKIATPGLIDEEMTTMYLREISSTAIRKE